MLRLSVFLAALFLPAAMQAQTPERLATVETLTEQAAALNLHQEQQWLHLLHYRDPDQRIPRSEISPGPFFLAADGSKNPQAELAATIDAAFAPVPENQNDHALCRYPARMRFLQESLGFTPPDQPLCSDLTRWRRGGKITGVSLVFASGDLGNPASFFGHILMKFDEAGEGTQTPRGLTDRSVNFGAVVPEGDNAAIYMLRGLFGGYPSSYSSTTYFQQRHDYGETQLRDLWEYQLNLSPAQVQLLVDHTWELQDARNTYFFLTRNCAYEFATLISTVLGQTMLPTIKQWSTPGDLFEVLSNTQLADGRPAVTRVTLVASRQQTFRQAYAALNRPEQRALRALLYGLAEGERNPPAFAALDANGQTRVLEVALQYARFGREKYDADSEEAAQARALQSQLVLLRLRQPAGAVITPKSRDVGPPHTGHSTSLLQATPLSNSDLGAGLELRLRPAYADLLSLDAGAVPYAGVSMGEVRLLVRDNHVSLRQLDLLRIDAFNVSPTGLPYDRTRAWKVRLGAEDRDLACDRCLVGFFEGGIGASLPIGERAASAAFLEARAVVGERGRTVGAEVGPNLAMVASLGEGFRISASARYLVTTGDVDNDRFEAGTDLRFGQSETWDIRLRGRYLEPDTDDPVSELGISASFFF